jgi:hypothetical protein
MIDDFEPGGPRNIVRSRPSRRRWQIGVRGLMKWMFGLSCLFGLLTLMGRRAGDALETGWRAQCLSNLCQIQLALRNYHETYGAFPPAYIADATGRPMHSWRVLILPFLEQQSLYDRYDFLEPWNGPNNILLLNKMPRVFGCPTRSPGPTALTAFAAITGPGTIFPGAGSAKLADVTDGPANTLMIAEVANVDIPWTAPVDLDARTMSLKINDLRGPGISSKHPGGAHICLGQGYQFLREGFSAETLRALITIDGGEGIKAEEAVQVK